MSTLLWLLLILPLFSTAANQFYLKRNAWLCSMLATGSALATLLISCLLFGKDVTAAPFPWIQIGDFSLPIELTYDRFAAGMMLVVTGVGALVHIFSLAYMRDDSSKARYFAGLSFFMFSMTGIVLASNFIMMFIFWELVGFCSYLLIGHWYQKKSAADAGNKAFLVNRVGDFGFMIGILLTYGVTQTYHFADMKDGYAAFLATRPDIAGGLLAAAVLCVFCGAVGKSSQLPLHVWLPDAMEGPTPISALMHAATMVAAGVYMLFRLQIAIGIGPEVFANFAGTTIAWVGGLTALAAALMAVQQNDIKRILAYSTISQLGYMVMAVGLGSGEAGEFHLFTHAWFKSLLFLGSGAVMFACHHEQDIWRMGGLLRRMPVTSATFLIGTAALVAVPLTSGFFSKEQILESAWHSNQALFWIAAFTAALTTFYMVRLVVVAFLGEPRNEQAKQASEVGRLMTVPMGILAILSLLAGFGFLNGLSPALPEGAGTLHFGPVFLISLLALVAGGGAAWMLYRGKAEDPLSLPVLRERLYIDAFYDKVLVRHVQDGSAAILSFIDEWVINGLLVNGSAKLSATFGNLMRRSLTGNLQGYSFLFAGGAVLVIYFTTFWN